MPRDQQIIAVRRAQQDSNQRLNTYGATAIAAAAHNHSRHTDQFMLANWAKMPAKAICHTRWWIGDNWRHLSIAAASMRQCQQQQQKQQQWRVR